MDWILIRGRMKTLQISVTLLLIVILSSCDNQTNNTENLKITDTAKGQKQDYNENTSIKSIMVNAVSLLRNHNVDVNNDRDFAEMMIYYNHTAIDMSNVLFNKGKNVELIKFTNESISRRKDVMNEMSTFLEREPKDESSSTKVFQDAINNAISKMRMSSNFPDKNFDNLFVKNMILHHESGIDMAEAEIKFGSHQTLKMRARNIISAEKDEIDWMQSWLKNK